VFCFGLISARPLEWSRYAKRTVDLGTLDGSGPERVAAGAMVRARFEYRVGRHGLHKGGAIRLNLSNEVIECNRRASVKRHLPEKDWSPLQWENPRAPGYLSVETTRRGAVLALEKPAVFSTDVRLVRGGPLRPGDRVTVRVGEDPRGPGLRAQLLSQRDVPFKFSFDLLGNGVFLPPRRGPHVEVTGREAQSLVLHGCTTPRPGEPFRLVVAAIDAYGNVADGYRGRVHFFPGVPLRGLPREYRFRAADRGVAEFRVAAGTKAVFTIAARDAGHPAVQGQSHLLVTDGSFGAEGIFFGDIHTHSQLSDGRLHPFEKYREVALHRGCDFWALTDHCYDLTPERIDLWNRTLARYNRPGAFVTLPGYEWTNSMGQTRWWARKQYGHRNVYFREPVTTVWDGVNARSNTPRKLYRALRESGKDFVVIDHMHCGEPAAVRGVDQAVEVSGWCGDFIREFRQANDIGGRYSIQDAFRRAGLMAVVAGSDHGTEAYYTGLPAEFTAVRCRKLTRDGVFEALRDGRVYATSGQKTLLKFTVNGRAPGDGFVPVRARRRCVEVAVGSAAPVTAVHLIRNGKPLANLGNFTFGVRSFAYVDEEPSLRRGYYTVRVHTAQGHTAWSSPVGFRLA
jgi:hypothetical protein